MRSPIGSPNGLLLTGGKRVMRKKIKKSKGGAVAATSTTRKLLERGAHVSTPITSVNNTPQRGPLSAVSAQPSSAVDATSMATVSAAAVDSPLGYGERGRRALFSPDTLAEPTLTTACGDVDVTGPGADGWL